MLRSNHGANSRAPFPLEPAASRPLYSPCHSVILFPTVSRATMSRIIAGCVLFLATSQLIAQVPPEKALATFQVNDPELEWTLWAHEPMFANPTCMDIDHLGRVWVCE